MADRTDPQVALDTFSRLLGISPISHIVKRGRDPQTARFTIVLEDHREIRVGTAKTFASQAELGRVLFVAIDTFPKKVEAADWANVLRALGNTGAITVEEIEGERFQDTVEEWLADYLDINALDADKAGAAAQGAPFRDNGHVHVSATAFRKYVSREHSEQVKLPELRQALTDLGFERKTIPYRKGQKVGTRSYYAGGATDILDSTTEEKSSQ